MKDYFESYVKQICDDILKFEATDSKGKQVDINEALEQWVARAKSTRDENGLIFWCGNGASCAMAEHMSHDWFQNAKVNTQTCSETSHITAISNDMSFENVFSYRIRRILSEKDILVTISSSGNSPNIIEAINAAHEKGSFVITLSGKNSDNKSRRLGDLNFWVPLPTYGLVESAHAVFLHIAIDLFLDKYEGGKH